MDVRSLMRTVPTINPDNTIQEAVALLKSEKLRELCVVDRHSLVGMITTLWLTEMGSNPTTKVRSIMFTPPNISSSESLDSAIRKMVDNAIETIPVVDGDKFKGAVTSDTILSSIKFEGLVRDAMIDPVTIQQDEKIVKAKRLMRMHNVNRLPVLDGKKLVGIITSSDIVRKLQLKSGYRKKADIVGDVIRYMDAPVKGLMTSQPVTVTSDASLNSAAKLMVKEDLRALPVVIGDRLIGLLCRKDIIKKLHPYVSGIMVNFSGVREEDDWEVVQLRHITSEWVKKLTHYGEFTGVLVSVKRMHVNKYKVTVKAVGYMSKQVHKRVARTTVTKTHANPSAWAAGYGLLSTTSDAFRNLEQELSRTKTK